MAATAAMAVRLRRMVDEATEDTWDDDAIDEYIETYPLIDVLGTDPQDIDFSTTPPTISEADEWIPTYDLHAAAANIWEEKAATIADEFDFKADGGGFSRSQKYDQFMAKSRFHSSKRSSRTIKMWVEPRISLEEENNA